MSRIGKKLITIPTGVTVQVKDSVIGVKGPKGELKIPFDSVITPNIDGPTMTFTRPNDEKAVKAKHGLYRALTSAAIVGVTTGYSKTLDIVGVGYKAELKGKLLFLSIGYSHPVYFKAPESISIACTTPTQIVITGIDKQLVGQVAAKIREIRSPEPYKGKGIKYSTESIRRKAGKTASR